MSAIVRQLKDDEGNILYPISKANHVYMSNGVDTIERILNDQMDQDTKVEFLTGKIVKTLASGTVVTTEFMDNGSIVETTKKDSVLLEKKTITFNEDGTINIKIGD